MPDVSPSCKTIEDSLGENLKLPIDSLSILPGSVIKLALTNLFPVVFFNGVYTLDLLFKFISTGCLFT